MTLIPRLSLAGALMVLLASGCGGASHPLAVVEHPHVETQGLPNVKRGEAMLLARSRVAFITTGSSSCVWWPKRLSVLDHSTIRIDMRVNGRVTTCTGGAVPFPIAVKIDPQIVDVHRPLTVRLAFRVRLPSGHINEWERTAVAPALNR